MINFIKKMFGCELNENSFKSVLFPLIEHHISGNETHSEHMFKYSIRECLPLNVCTMLLLIICHNWASPVCGAITKCCLDGAITIERITPVPDTVIVRIYQKKGKKNKMKINVGKNCSRFDLLLRLANGSYLARERKRKPSSERYK